MADDLVTPLTVVVDLAEQALAEPPSEIERFLKRSDRYLKALDAWRAQLASGSGIEGHPQHDELLQLIERLNAVHSEIVKRSQDMREEVAQELSAMHKRASALKSYIDRFPKRVTITGKREG